jgi:hypothetical protein
MFFFPDIKRLFLFFAILISFYVIYCLVDKRQHLLTANKKQTIAEPFESIPSITNMKSSSLPLCEYVIKSSINSAVNTSIQIDLEMIAKVLRHGCRFLDFEVYSIDNVPKVGYSSNKSFTSIETEVVDFIDVMKKIASSAFAPPTPNAQDPLFIQLRLKTKNYDILPKMATDIESSIKSRLYDGPVTKDTILSTLSNRVILIVDINYMSNYKAKSCNGQDANKCNDFSKYVHVNSGSSELYSTEDGVVEAQALSPLKITENGRTNVKMWQMVTPGFGIHHSDKNSKSFFSFIKRHMIQIVPFKFYMDDDKLQEYENFFSDNGKTAFVPLTSAFNYIEQAERS